MILKAILCGKQITIILETDEQYHALKRSLGKELDIYSLQLRDVSSREIDNLGARSKEDSFWGNHS